MLDITVSRFHALTFEAERRFSNAGVHNIDFTIQVVDAATGQVLAGPEAIEAALPALRCGDGQARRQGQTRNRRSSPICAPPSRAGWAQVRTSRRSFSRMGN